MLMPVYSLLHKYKIALNICAIVCDIIFSITHIMIFNDMSIIFNLIIAYC